MNDSSHWGPGFVGLRNGRNTHTLIAFLVWGSQPCLGGGEGVCAGRGRVTLEYGLPDFQEAKAVSICLGTWGQDSLSIKMLVTTRCQHASRLCGDKDSNACAAAAAAAGSAAVALGPGAARYWL